MKVLRNVTFAFMCICLLSGAFAFRASAVEASPVPTETVGISAPPASETQESEAPVDTPDTGESDTPVVLADPSAGTDFDGLAYMDISCNLGAVRLYVPYGVDVKSLQVVDGMLYNTSNSTVYLYCREYPTYTFQASRWESVYYRSDSYSNSVELTDIELQTAVPAADTAASYLQLFCLIAVTFCMIGGIRK